MRVPTLIFLCHYYCNLLQTNEVRILRNYMQSAVQSRIASFEAASRRGMSPSRPIPDIRNYRHRPTNAIGPINELDSKEQKQQQAKAELDVSIPRSRQKHRTLNYESISLEVKGTSSFDRNEIDTKTCGTILRIRTGSDESYGEDYQKKGCSKSTPVDQSSREDSSYFLSPSSTTMTASENRKSRIRRSIRENNNSTPTTNLSEKRRQRLLLQSRRRTKNDVPDLNSEGCGDETANLGTYALLSIYLYSRFALTRYCMNRFDCR